MNRNSRNNQVSLSTNRGAGSTARAAPAPAAAAVPRHGPVQDRAGDRQPGQGHCNICSYTQEYPARQVPVYHRHFSSRRLREMSGAENSNNPYYCPSCKHQHQPDPTNRIKVVVSDSTLHNFFSSTARIGSRLYRGDASHVDYVTIPGADINTLRSAFRLDYMEKPHSKPLDVVMVAGYNDLLEGTNREYILHEFERFADLVKMCGLRSHPDSSNSVAIASLMYPPQIAWFPDNGAFPQSNYDNQIHKIDWLNQKIHLLNMENRVPLYPRFHTYGVRTATRYRTDEFGELHQYVTKSHRWEHWREADRGNMLHLTDVRRFKMGQAINNYFRINTTN